VQTSRTKRCPDCYGRRALWGDGNCPGCAGSGKSLNLSIPDQECRECQGTGVCRTCDGCGTLKGPSFALIQVNHMPGRLVLCLILFVILCFGSMRFVKSRYLSSAVAAAAVFHSELSRHQVVEVYAKADEEFRRGVTFSSLMERIDGVGKRLGDCNYAGPVTWRVSVSPRGIYVVTKYRGRCALGTCEEILNWHVLDGTARLAKLSINQYPKAKENDASGRRSE
jgi:hypothetical protein